MRCNKKREFTIRRFQKRFEAKPRARTKINKRKYFGVKKNIKEYKKAITDHFNNLPLLNRALKGPQDLAVKMNKYFIGLSANYDQLLETARDLLGDSFEKGSKRVLDNSGGTIKLDEPVDQQAVDILTQQQTAYYDNLSEAQSKKVNEVIAKGLEEGETDQAIAEEIKSEIKSISNTRALRISRTEIVKSHTIAQTETMSQAGIDEYNYITSNDKKVSKICRKNQGAKGREKIYKTALAGTAQNPLPVLNSHPNCRCTTVAYIKP